MQNYHQNLCRNILTLYYIDFWGHSSAIIFKNGSNTVQNHEILNFLGTFRSHPGKGLKVNFNLFLRIPAYKSGKKI